MLFLVRGTPQEPFVVWVGVAWRCSVSAVAAALGLRIGRHSESGRKPVPASGDEMPFFCRCSMGAARPPLHVPAAPAQKGLVGSAKDL